MEAGLLVSHKGKTSVKYEVGIFTKGSNLPVAHGHFVHVFVDEKTRKPTPFSEEMAQSIDAIYSQ